MAMEYINYIKAKAHISTASKSEIPVLSEEDERFLNHITSDEIPPPPLPARPKIEDLPVAGESTSSDAQLALLDGAQNIALPETPKEAVNEPTAELKERDHLEHAHPKRPTWSWLRRDSRDRQRRATAAGLMDVAEGLKSADARPNEDEVVRDEEAAKEGEDMTIVLERLNLAAVNNRVFSISEETQELLQRFNQIFKDIMNGAPTAYEDLESLLTNGDRQLQKTFNHLPGFLQTLIEQLPSRLTSGFAPEIMAAAAERAERSGINMQNAGKAATAAKKMGYKVPSLKDLIGKPGAVAGIMRSIITFLRTRFPAFLGMNVLWSLALFLLLFVFWYCHKRGRDVRLEKERRLTEAEVARLEKEHDVNSGDILTTTAPEGAPMEDVTAGMKEVEEARRRPRDQDEASGMTQPSISSTAVQPAEQVG